MLRSERPFSVGSVKEVKLDSQKSPEEKIVVEKKDLKIETELAIKNSRLAPATSSEQHSEFLHYIARKERKVLELREELKRHEEELRLLKKQWETHFAKNIDEASNNNSPSSASSAFSFASNSEEEGKGFMDGLSKGIAGVIGGIQKVKDSELTQEKLTQIKTVVTDVANSQSIQQTRRKTADITSSAWLSLSKGFSSLASSETIQNARKKTLETVNTINEALVLPSVNYTTTNPSSEDTTTAATKSKLIISESPSEEIEDPILHVIGDDII
ncbi:6303_t:CDS:2 [Funneliformis geosporum]|uniref:5825_t:CDS:1 n=1 Tax=Funneliformis geosporum TaxID=1117311 RepID=A0A9W4T090_9GLOM|nr:5825_t:CDS:2 [Funneliformis geosporum]CAI2188258.1 6303_t:CDS:2 [Funneliformis geosporum]